MLAVLIGLGAGIAETLGALVVTAAALGTRAAVAAAQMIIGRRSVMRDLPELPLQPRDPAWPIATSRARIVAANRRGFQARLSLTSEPRTKRCRSLSMVVESVLE
jgi:hypothetical protein